METLYLLIPVSVVLVFLIGVAFWWSLRNGQFDDLEGPAYRILMDDDKAKPENETAFVENVAAQQKNTDKSSPSRTTGF